MRLQLQEPAMQASVPGYRPIAASLDQYYLSKSSHLALLLVLTGYLVAATLFAVVTPPWQNPDEPAHYNNIATIASGRGLPFLHPGDYDQEYLNALVSGGFPPHLSIEPLRYEAYQPPLYYVAAVPAFLLGQGNPVAVRLFNVLLGAGSLLLLYACLTTVFPTKPLLTVGATAFAAFLPMHVAMNASINNDGLAGLLLLATLLVLLRWMKQHFSSPSPSTALGLRSLLGIGLLLGLGMATKIYAYALLPLAAGAVFLTLWLAPQAQLEQPPSRPTRRSLAQGVQAVATLLLPALLLASPLWARNLTLYGPGDFLGLQAHDRIVVGQPMTAEWIAREGWIPYLERGMDFTFRSFWGVFGWMGVFMEPRIYVLLLVFSGIVLLGLLWALVRFICGRPETDMDRYQFWVLGLFGTILLAVLASFLWYNLKFVQHQGRYFFWGLLPISTFVALAWRELMQPLQGRLTGMLGVVLAVALAVADLRIDILDRWSVLLIGLFGMTLLLQPFFLIGAVDRAGFSLPPPVDRLLSETRWRPLFQTIRLLIWAFPFLALFLLDLLIPFRYILPQLGG